MSEGREDVAIGTLLDAVLLLRGEVAALAESNERIEASHRELQQRLDTIDAGLAGVTNLVPLLELIVARINDAHSASQAAVAGVHDTVAHTRNGVGDVTLMVEKLLAGASAERRQQRSDQRTTSALIAFTRAAILGNSAALPVDVEDDPLLEHYVLNQSADVTSGDRALVDWRAWSSAAETAELIALLRKQQTPSPTDTPQTRILRYRLAAITRAQIEGRGGTAPPPPNTTRAMDQSAAACLERSKELAAIWRVGETLALYAEAELAGAIDLFTAAERQAGPSTGGVSPPELVVLHREIGNRIQDGERPTIGDGRRYVRLEHGDRLEAAKDR